MNLDLGFIKTAFPIIVKQIPVTLQIVAGALLIAIPFGLLFALILIKKIPVLRQCISLFISIIRGTPTLLQIYLMYNRGPALIRSFFLSIGREVDVYSWNPIVYACIIISFSSTVYLTEAFRTAILAIDKGQVEAAHSVGMTTAQAYRRILLPQAVAVAIPIIDNTVVNAIKNSSLAFALDVLEITGAAQALAYKYFRFFETYIIIFIIYLVLVGLIEVLFRQFRKRMFRFQTV